MPQTQPPTKPINNNLLIGFADEGFLDYLNPYNFSNSSNHLKFLFFHLSHNLPAFAVFGYHQELGCSNKFY
jgi:hypothetical protein